ncbi:NADP-dependent oxidoreductase [Zavarzinia sp. CC-PAN008]|uniref:NADP-dependent oxidoreductase n=1 Tax=Zavarzinia sp. CC-PAN008 TaxID=3243332 RepID=UPI003F745E83
MAERMNRQWRLARRPTTGTLDRSHFDFVTEPVPALHDGQFLVRLSHLSCDPTQRGWAAGDTYWPAIPLGEVMRGFSGGTVIESRHPDFREGERVQGLFGWQDYAVTNGTGLFPALKIPDGIAMEQALGVFGLTGLTAYFGLLEVGRPKPGETVLVSGAAGATGAIVGQIAKVKGCRAVGIAGGADKCRWLVEQAGFDAAIDYKAGDLAGQLAQHCPQGVDVFFDNVGGEILDAALGALAMHARVVICGAIARYQDFSKSTGMLHATYLNLLMRRSRMEGFLVLDYYDRLEPALKDLTEWVRNGRIKDKVDVRPGLDKAPEIYDALFTGGNDGKLLIQV